MGYIKSFGGPRNGIAGLYCKFISGFLRNCHIDSYYGRTSE